jgi:hypothetical protein
MARLTQEQIHYFIERIQYWVDYFEANHYSWNVRLASEGTTGLARTKYNSIARWADVELVADWGIYPITKVTLDSTALHEVLEGGVFADLRSEAEDREFSQERFDIEMHRVIRLFEKLLAKERVTYDISGESFLTSE